MPIGRYEDDAIRGLRSRRRSGIAGAWPIEREVAWIAERQGGHIHREQLRDLGLTTSSIDRRMVAGRLHRVGRGTYAVGHPRLSHRAGAGRIGLMTFVGGVIDVTLSRSHRAQTGVLFHRRKLPEDEVIIWDGLPVTTVGRTLFDLAGCVDEFSFRRAVKEAAVQRLDCRPSLPMLLRRHPRPPGAALIRAVIAEGAVPIGVVPTDGEERFLAIVREGAFPAPVHRCGITLADGWVEVDFAWPELRIVVEVDSSFHEEPIALETAVSTPSSIGRCASPTIRGRRRNRGEEEARLALRVDRRLHLPRTAHHSSTEPGDGDAFRD